jgi:CRISPR-associated protein Csb2
MIAISLRFLVGRFHATPWGRHVNEGVIEYPPSPWRLLRTLVATFYRARPAGVAEEQLKRILVALASAPPAFHLPPAGVAHTRHYDVANGSLKFFDTFLVTDVEKKSALATAVEVGDAIIWLWPDVELSAGDRDALGTLLRATNTFGRAESWCEAELLDTTNKQANCRLFDLTFAATEMRGAEPVRVLAPQTREWAGDELLKALTIETSAMRKEKQLEPPGAAWLTYARPLNLLGGHTGVPRRKSQKKPRVTVVRFALDSNVLPLVLDTLPFCESARWAILDFRKKMSAPFSEVLTGKEAADETTRLKGHAHAHYLATDEDGDGRLDHLTVYAARGFDEDDLKAVAALRAIYRHGSPHKVFAVLIGMGEVKDFASASQHTSLHTATLLQRSKRWRSVTPFVLPRFATRGAGKGARPRDTPVEQLKREARLRQLPEITEVYSSEVNEDLKGYKVGARLVRWLEFRTRRFNGTTGYGTAGFEIEFAEEVNAPLALGFGCHFGLGLFEPV